MGADAMASICQNLSWREGYASLDLLGLLTAPEAEF
jgi:hypothetical protein